MNAIGSDHFFVGRWDQTNGTQVFNLDLEFVGEIWWTSHGTIVWQTFATLEN